MKTRAQSFAIWKRLNETHLWEEGGYGIEDIYVQKWYELLQLQKSLKILVSLEGLFILHINEILKKQVQ